MALRIGMHAGQQNIEIDELRRLWRFADEHGFDFLSCWDHFYEAPPTDGTSPCFEAVACMAAMAMETKRVRIGCHVFCMTYRNPGLLANAMMTVDHLSGGRVEVGVGAGWHATEHEAYGYRFDPPKQRLDREEEGIQVLRLLFTQERSNFTGESYDRSAAVLYPPPVQQPLPHGVGGPRGTRRARSRVRSARRCCAGQPT